MIFAFILKKTSKNTHFPQLRQPKQETEKLLCVILKSSLFSLLSKVVSFAISSTSITTYICHHLRDCFPNIVSYNRFIELSHRSAVPFMLFLHYCCRGECTGISFIDSTVVRLCHNKRIKRNKVFKDLAERGKSSMGWFFGFKLHLIINDKGEILSFYLSKGSVDDRNAKAITKMTKDIFGKLFGDKGYISKALSDMLFSDGIHLITAVRRNMKEKALSNEEKLLMPKDPLLKRSMMNLKTSAMQSIQDIVLLQAF